MKRLGIGMIAIAAATTVFGDEWYVDPVNGLDTRDGTTSNVVSEAKGPRKTLEKAMDLVNAGDTLWLLPGEYSEGSMRDGRTRIYVSKNNVKVRSTDGASKTFIVGEGGTTIASTSSKSCAQVASGFTGVIFEGITFKDGCGQRHDIGGTIRDNGGGIGDYTEGRGNIWAVDCIFTNCYAYMGGGMYFGNALRCRFVNCGAENSGGAVARGKNFAFCLFDGCATSSISTFTPFTSGNKFYNCTFCGNVGNAFYQNSLTHSVLNSIIVGYEKNGSVGMYATNSVMGTASCADAFNCLTDTSVADSGLVPPLKGDFRVNESSTVARLGDASLLAGFPAPTGYSLDKDLAGDAVPSSGSMPAGCLVETRSCHLYVDCENGDDGSDGSQGHPYKTIRAATTNALSGDIIHVAPGTYGAAEGSQTATSKIKARVVVPVDVTLESTAGAEKTFIVGEAATESQIDNAEYGTGTNAVRCVYAKSGATVRGFTLTGGRGVGTGDYSNNGNGAAFMSAADRAATLEDCIVSNNASYRGVIFQAVVKRCRVFENVGTRADNVSGPAGSSCSWYNCIIDKNRGMGAIQAAYAVESCTIGANNVEHNGGLSQVLYWYGAGKRSVVNTAILGGRFYVGGGAAICCTNCLLVDDTFLLNDIRERAYNCIITNSAAMQVEAKTYRPVLGSFVGIDRGDAAYSTAALGDRDAYGMPRILNGAIDMGAVEYDWRPTFAHEIGRRFNMTYASPSVTTNAMGGLLVPDGAVAGTVGMAGPYEFTFGMTGGSAQVYVGGVLVGEASGTGEKLIRFNVANADDEIRFVYTPDAGSTAILKELANKHGFIITFW